MIRFTCILLSVLCCAATAGALSVVLSPTAVEPGEQVSVRFSDLPDGSNFTLLAEGSFPADESLTFQLTAFVLPFSLVDGAIEARVAPVRHAVFKVKKGDMVATMEASPPDGTFSRAEPRNISAGTYAYLRIAATPLSPGLPVSSAIQLMGTKQGPKEGTISFSVDGMSYGKVRVVILLDGAEALNEVLTIGTFDPGVASPDGVALLTGPRDPSTRLLLLEPSGIPAGWRAVTGSYRIVSPLSGFGSGALLTITAPDTVDPDRDTIVIAHATGSSWEILPGRIHAKDGATAITAPVREPGDYCLVALGGADTAIPSTRASLPVFLAFGSLVAAGLFAKRW
jgi:hypothetical protein